MTVLFNNINFFQKVYIFRRTTVPFASSIGRKNYLAPTCLSITAVRLQQNRTLLQTLSRQINSLYILQHSVLPYFLTNFSSSSIVSVYFTPIIIRSCPPFITRKDTVWYDALHRHRILKS